LSFLLFGGLLYLTGHLWQTTPSGFIPEEDQGSFIIAVVLPDGASLDRTDALASEVEKFVLQQPEIRNIVTLGGLNFLAGGTNNTNASAFFASLKNWSEREGEEHHINSVIGRVMQHFGNHPDGIVMAFN